MKKLILGSLAPLFIAASVATASAFHGSHPTSFGTPTVLRKGQPAVLPSAPVAAAKADAGQATATPAARPVGGSSDRSASTAASQLRACVASYDPACGALIFDPMPAANQPIAAQVFVWPAHPAVGQKVSFTVTATDPDAPARGCSDVADFGDGALHVACNPPVCARFGKWSPPPAAPGRFAFTVTHQFAHPGAFAVTIPLASATPGWAGCPDPYASVGEATVTVEITRTATQNSVNGAYIDYEPNGAGGAGSAVSYTRDGPQPDLDFHALGMQPRDGTNKAVLHAYMTNQTDQAIYFPHGLDVIFHMCRGSDGSWYDAHVVDSSIDKVEPGQKVEAAGTTDLPDYGGYSVKGSVEYAFVPNVDQTPN